MITTSRAVSALILGVALIAASFLGLSKLSINSDARVFFPESNIERQRLDAFEEEYALGKNLAIAVHAQEGTLFTEDRLTLLRDLTEGAWTLPGVTRVESIINATHISSVGDDIVIEAMGDDTDLTAEQFREKVLSDNLLSGRLVTEDGKTTVVMANVVGIKTSREASERAIAAADELVSQLSLNEAGLEVWYGGRVASDHAFSLAGKTDLAALLPVAFAVITLLLIVVLRSLSFALVLTVVPALAAVATLGLAGHARVEITAMTANIPTIVVALGIAALLHFMMEVRALLRSGSDHQKAVENALKETAVPTGLTFLTTIIGFLSLNAAESPPLQMLGTLTALGAGLCLFFAILLMPGIILVLKPKVRPEWPIIIDATDMFANLVVDHPKRLLAGISAGAAVLFSGILLMEVNDYFPHFFDDSYRYRRDADRLEAELPAYNALQFHIETADNSPILTPERLEKIAAFEEYLKSQDKVVFTASMAETMRRLHRHLNAGQRLDSPFPDTENAVAQYTLLYEMSLPMGLDISNQITMDKTGTRILALVKDAKSTEVLSLAAMGEAWLRDNDLAPRSFATGQSSLYANITMMNVRSMTSGTIIALVLISAILVFAFRSLRYGLVSLLPNLLPAAIAFGVWGVLVGEVGVASSVVAAVTLGVIVDDTIHIIWRYREARALGFPPTIAARQMLHRAGEPILISSVVLSIGFGALLVSGFWITESLGALSALIIISALVTDVFLLTPILVLADKWLERHAPRRAAPETIPISAAPLANAPLTMETAERDRPSAAGG